MCYIMHINWYTKMKSFDELLKMSDEEKDQYLTEEVEKLLATCDPYNVLKLRHLQSEINRIKKTTVDPYARASRVYGKMMDKFLELDSALKPFRTGK